MSMPVIPEMNDGLPVRNFIGEKQAFELIEYTSINYIYVYMGSFLQHFMHSHRDIELVYITKGTGTLFLPAMQDIPIKPNDFLLFNSNLVHGFAASTDEPLQFLVLQLNPNLFESVFPQIRYIVFDTVLLSPSYFPGELYANIRNSFFNMALHYYYSSQTNPLYCSGMIHCLFYEFINHMPLHVLSEAEKQKQATSSVRLSRIQDFIEKNYTSKIKLSDLAEQEGLSLSYLSRFFKTFFNMTFQEYVTNQRLKHAIKLLNDPNKKLIDICMESGFSDYKYMYQAFLKAFGCTPQKYQETTHDSSLFLIPGDVARAQIIFDSQTSVALLHTYAKELEISLSTSLTFNTNP